MSKIFCLETEWIKTIHDLKCKSTVQSLLEFVETSMNVQYVYRSVACEADFNYYIEHLERDSYNAYDMVYLCFHGTPLSIEFADKSNMDIMKFAENHPGIFAGRNVHFGCCSTLAIPEDKIKRFKSLTGARMVTGYAKDVEFFNSFVFELWLLNALCVYPEYGGIRLQKLAEKSMKHYADKFNFVAY